MAVSGSIKQIQQALNKLGYRGMTGSPIQENGVWTPDTQYAFAKYQMQEGRNKAKSVSNFSSSLQVASLQELLNRAGYTDMNGNKLAVDGVMGSKTRYALDRFNYGEAAEESKNAAAPAAQAAQKDADRPAVILAAGQQSTAARRAAAREEENEGGVADAIINQWRSRQVFSPERDKEEHRGGFTRRAVAPPRDRFDVTAQPEEESDEEIIRGMRESAQRVVFPRRAAGERDTAEEESDEEIIRGMRDSAQRVVFPPQQHQEAKRMAAENRYEANPGKSGALSEENNIVSLPTYRGAEGQPAHLPLYRGGEVQLTTLPLPAGMELVPQQLVNNPQVQAGESIGNSENSYIEVEITDPYGGVQPGYIAKDNKTYYLDNNGLMRRVEPGSVVHSKNGDYMVFASADGVYGVKVTPVTVILADGTVATGVCFISRQ